MKMKYFLIRIFYKNEKVFFLDFKRCTEHIIKANTKEEALQIRKKYNIAHPLQKEMTSSIYCIEVSSNSWRVEKRRRGIGGSIWYEENGELKTEKV